jgi:folate-dependent phosphoribosylglycinamide formyltransferase PurN
MTVSPNKPIKVAMLCGRGASARMMYHGIASHAQFVSIIVEESVPPTLLIRRRATKLGRWRTFGQLLFIVTNKLFQKLDEKRCKKLLEEHTLVDTEFPSELVLEVKTINSVEVIEKLLSVSPDLVVVNGTRIIGVDVLDAIKVPIVNTHMGITPRYRGVHGGYWALACGDSSNCGVTVHRVDAGIDTGGVLYQALVEPGRKDTFNTYPILQMAAAIPLMQQVIRDISYRELQEIEGVQPSRLWYHPTIWQYVYYWLKLGRR